MDNFSKHLFSQAFLPYEVLPPSSLLWYRQEHQGPHLCPSQFLHHSRCLVLYIVISGYCLLIVLLMLSSKSIHIINYINLLFLKILPQLQKYWHTMIQRFELVAIWVYQLKIQWNLPHSLLVWVGHSFLYKISCTLLIVTDTKVLLHL